MAQIILPLLRAWSDMRRQAAELNKQMVAMGRENQHCRLLMSVPGVGIVTATAFTAAVEDPANFKNSRSVGTWAGLTTYQSGEVDYDGHISRRGDSHLRTLLYEAAAVILKRSKCAINPFGPQGVNQAADRRDPAPRCRRDKGFRCALPPMPYEHLGRRQWKGNSPEYPWTEPEAQQYPS